MYTHKNESSPVKSIGERKRQAQMWKLERDDKAVVNASRAENAMERCWNY